MQLFYILLSCLVILFRYGQSQTILETGVSDSEQQQIVDLHNNYRLQIANGSVPKQPRGINLKRMKYDDDLAKAAQVIANTTKFAHVRVTDDRWRVGQNLYISMSSNAKKGAKWDDAVLAWFEEYKLFTYSECCTSGTGHYTQVVWADTEYVGCGYTYFSTPDELPFQALYVCNYGPAGNWLGEYPYKTGDSGCERLC